MKLAIKQWPSSKEIEHDVLDFVESALLDAGQAHGELEIMARISRNNAKALALVITALAKQGAVSASEVTNLGSDYYEKARFSDVS